MRIRATIDQVNHALDQIEKVGTLWIDKDFGTGEAKGRFEAKGVTGKFIFDRDTEVLTIVITEKPWLASDAMIEEKIREFFN